MKIHIIFDIKEQPTGGGNQFLKALRDYFIFKEKYAENPKNADVFLFNSYQYISEVLKYKKKFTDKLFIHRIDGPIRLYSQMSDKRDAITNITNKYLADATIFQSEWSKQANYSLGLERTNFETVIINAPDSNIFNRKEKKVFQSDKKIKIIATSWSSEYKKGFAVYKYLDKNFDFSKYEMTFCGNTSEDFKNIKHIKPIPGKELAKQLKKHDIFITASQKDPCSNSLIEALHCGLPAIALNDGGHPEIIKKAGELFENKEEISSLLQKISENYNDYVNKINVPELNEVAEKYLTFFNDIFQSQNKKTKNLHLFNILKIRYTILKHKIRVEFLKFRK